MDLQHSNHVTVSVERVAQRDYEENGARYYGNASWAYLDPRTREQYIEQARRRLERLR
jgi:hypothetical protein